MSSAGTIGVSKDCIFRAQSGGTQVQECFELLLSTSASQEAEHHRSIRKFLRSSEHILEPCKPVRILLTEEFINLCLQFFL